jgi:hypothetical protein
MVARRRNIPGEAGSVRGACDASGSTVVTVYVQITSASFGQVRWSGRRAYRTITLIGRLAQPR